MATKEKVLTIGIPLPCSKTVRWGVKKKERFTGKTPDESYRRNNRLLPVYFAKYDTMGTYIEDNIRIALFLLLPYQWFHVSGYWYGWLPNKYRYTGQPSASNRPKPHRFEYHLPNQRNSSQPFLCQNCLVRAIHISQTTDAHWQEPVKWFDKKALFFSIWFDKIVYL